MQTAVEWLECELKKIPFTDPIKAFKQAKQMEKDKRFTEEDVRKAFREGLSYTTHKTYHSFSEDSYISSLKNNNETYGSKGSDEPNGNSLEKVPNVVNVNIQSSNNFCVCQSSNCYLINGSYICSTCNKPLKLSFYNTPTSSQTEISDEEIEKAVKDQMNDAYDFREGAKWYREQLKKK